MITIKTSNYDDDSLRILLKALKAGADSIYCTNKLECSSCSARVPCADLARAIAFVKRRLDQPTVEGICQEGGNNCETSGAALRG